MHYRTNLSCTRRNVWMFAHFAVIDIMRRQKVFSISYHAFLFEMDITDLKNGYVIPKFWVLENFLHYHKF